MSYSWTVMVYMAGDNGKLFNGEQLMADLQSYGWRNIVDMSQVGSTDQVAVVVQYDTLNHQQFTPRLFIDGSNPTGKLVETVPPVNTGDPQNLTDFIAWAEQAYPAQRYALILWNHGSGWKQDDIYIRFRESVERAVRGGEARAGGRGERVLRESLFLATPGAIMSIEDDEARGICYDDTSMDFLDNQKLALALAQAQAQTGCRLSLLGMDACLMNTIEVAYQVSNYADYMVGSQEVESAEGWPYAPILLGLTQMPAMSACELGQLIVHEFGEYYTTEYGGSISTQSALDLAAIGGCVNKIKAVAEHVEAAYSADVYIRGAVHTARHYAQRFRDPACCDVGHLLEILSHEYQGAGPLSSLAGEAAEQLAATPPAGPIAANFRGGSRKNARGLSIYFPSDGCSPFYSQQAFAVSGWHRVICRANGVEPGC